jgi:hypothetical protein
MVERWPRAWPATEPEGEAALMVGARIREQGQLQAVDFRQAAARNALQVAVQAGRRFDDAAKLLFELGPNTVSIRRPTPPARFCRSSSLSARIGSW